MAIRSVKLTDATVRCLMDRLSWPEILERKANGAKENTSGFVFVEEQQTGNHDNHGNTEIRLIVKRERDNQLFAGLYYLDPGEGEVYEYPKKFVPVVKTEKTIVVIDYVEVT